MAFASNDSFSGWTKTFTDARLCAAIVDRLTFGGNIIETGTDSYRLAHTEAKKLPQAELTIYSLKNMDRLRAQCCSSCASAPSANAGK